tara:strand:+ start:1222 stop:1686 length:465 start_codon:yes stop_codon:yes gene_type:complete
LRILGIDPGLARVGYGVIDAIEDDFRMLDCGIIKTEPKDNEGQRLKEIFEDLNELITNWKPDIAAVEKFFFYRSSNTINVVQARGVIIMALAKSKISILEFAPMQIKLAVAGSGKATKNDVLEAVMQELNLVSAPKPDDAADALAIALTGLFLK